MSEELDELASAYADGEATPEEAARVESTPELLDRVDEFRAVRVSSLELPAPDPTVKERHLSAALAAFDEQQPSVPSKLASTRISPTASTTEAADADPAVSSGDDRTVVPLQQRSKRRTPPAWILNAAAAVVVVAGVGYAVTQLPSESDDTATDAVAESDAGADESFDAASSSNAPSAAIEREADGDEAQSLAQPADDGEAMEAGATEEEAAEEAMADTDDAADEEAAASTTTSPSAPLLGVSGDLTASEVLSLFDAEFDDGVLATTPHPCQDLVDSLVNPATGTMLGYVAVDYGGQPADLIVFDTGGERGALLVDPDACSVLSSS